MTVSLRPEGWSTTVWRNRTDFTSAVQASPTPENITEVVTLGFEVEEAGRYEINARATLQCGTGTAFNEGNLILILDGSFLVPRVNVASLNSVVAIRWTHNFTRSVILSEGQHIVRLGTWAIGATATVVAGSGADDTYSIAVRRA